MHANGQQKTLVGLARVQQRLALARAFVADADLLLHVVDSASHAREEQMLEVNKVLAEIGADRVPQLLVWNKIDLTEAGPGVELDEYDKIRRVRVSARSGLGLDLLRGALAEAARDKAAARQGAADETAPADLEAS